MSELAAPTATTPEPLSGATSVVNPHSQRLRWFELTLVLTLAFSGSLRSSLFLLKHGPNPALIPSSGSMAFAIVRQLACILLLAYVLRRRGWKLQNLGLRWSFRSVFLGLLLAAAHFFAIGVVCSFLRASYRTWIGPLPHLPNARDFFGQGNLMLIPFSFVNPFYEELIVRAYVMTELLDLTSSPLLTVFASVALQFSYHLYYGWLVATALSAGFLIFSLYYLRTRNATTIVAAHTFVDILGTVRLW